LRVLLPRRLRPHRILRGPLRGCTIVTSWHDYPAALLGYTEQPLMNWFSANVQPGEAWLDVGAHYGYTSLALSRLVGPHGRVFAFEPVLSTAACLESTRLLNDLTQLAVLPIGLTADQQLAMLTAPLVRGMADYGLESGRASTILVAALDKIWESLSPGTRIDGIKIDVQGMELDVLEGMRGVLSKWHPRLIIELHKGVDRNSLRTLLRLVGYSSNGIAIGTASVRTAETYENDRSYLFIAREAA
jgi:FkbM family methyltransferase